MGPVAGETDIGVLDLRDPERSGEAASLLLASFARHLMEPGAVPDSVHQRVRQLVVDQIGIQIGCADLPWSTAVHDYLARLGSKGTATVMAHGTRMHPELAAFVNAAFGHGQDFDDTCMLVQTHAGAVVIPVALAVGEHVGASGAEVLAAATAGLEVILRVAHSATGGRSMTTLDRTAGSVALSTTQPSSPSSQAPPC